MNEYLKNVNRIEFIVTMACTGRCIHCSEGEHTHCLEHIDPDVAANAVRDICEHYDIRSLMTFGGEPLLYPETVARIHEAASQMEIPQRELITNGYFSKNPSRIAEVAGMLELNGVNRILLSVDAFHQATIPLEIVKYFASCVKQTKISLELAPAWLASREDENPYNLTTRALLQEFDDLHVKTGNGNVIFPSGNALKYLKEYFSEDVELYNPYEEDPADLRTVSFDPNGDVLDGNIYRNDIFGIMKSYCP